jgi:hypothetical protein
MAKASAKTAAGKVKIKSAESTPLVKSYPDRAALYVSNPGAKDVWLALGPTAVKEEGILVKKELGGSQPILIQGYTGEVAGIATESEIEVAFAEL